MSKSTSKRINSNIISPNDILNDIDILYKSNGFINVRIYKDLGKYTIYQINKHFGSFNNALKQLNLFNAKIAVQSKIDKQKLIDDVMNIFNKNKDNFNVSLYYQLGNFTDKEVKEVFGTFTNMVKELGLLKYQRFNKEEAILAAKEILNNEGDLTQSLFFEKTNYPIRAFKTTFGSFTNFIKEANLEETIKQIKKDKSKQSAENRPTSNKYQFKNVTKEELIQDIQNHQSNCTTKFTSQYYYQNSKFTRGLINKYFGSFTNMLEELDFQINMDKNHTREEVVEHMLNLYQQHGKLTSSIQRNDGKYGQDVINKYFGSFENMKKELNINEGYKRNISIDELLEDLLKIVKKHGFINSTLIDKEGRYSRPTYLYRLGGNIKSISEHLSIVNNSRSTISTTGKYCLYSFSKLLNTNYELEKTFDWLINPETNTKLRIDGYFEDYKLAIEYDGMQHYHHITFYDPNYNDFKRRQKLDKLKDKLIKENGITLIRVRYDEPLTEEYLRQKLIDANIVKADI